MNKMKNTQAQRILKHLKTHRAMTTFEARNELDVPHPGSRIQELRARGNDIVTNRRWVDGHKIAEYILMSSGK